MMTLSPPPQVYISADFLIGKRNQFQSHGVAAVAGRFAMHIHSAGCKAFSK
jgi:hypothetical protein